jgi:N-acetylmuramoyl-L-alanine amidase
VGGGSSIEAGFASTQTGDSRQELRLGVLKPQVFAATPNRSCAGAFTAQEDGRMSRNLERTSALAVAAMLLSIVGAAESAGAASTQTPAGLVDVVEPVVQTVSQPVVQPIPAETEAPTPAPVTVAVPKPANSTSLAAMVAKQPQPGELSRELHCLAGAIYFESKSETLTGQLAVGRVVVARAKSGRFPNSYCGVVFQPSQFSFVRGQSMPGIAKGSKQWKNAVAVAQIAHSNAWASPVEGALYFHAAYVSPGWRLKRLGRIDNHVFYR